MQIELIVARARNGVIGSNNRMLWHIPEDFAHFKKTTMGHAVVMGRKTWESIGRPLPGRKNVVITRQPGYVAEGAQVVASLDEALENLTSEDRVFVIGGGEIYRQALLRAHRVWVTIVDKDFEGDTTFPELSTSMWTPTLMNELPPTEDRNFAVKFLYYDRRTQK